MPFSLKPKGDDEKRNSTASNSNRNSYNGNGASVPPPAYVESEEAVHVVDGKPPTGYDEPRPAAPPVDITAAFANLKVTSLPRDPDSERCLAHLKLLAAFQNLKEDIGYTDG
jgi:hypothetical protein